MQGIELSAFEGGTDYSVTAYLVEQAHGYELNFSLHGDLSQVEGLEPGEGGERLSNLWKHTCFEVFLGLPAGRYREVNISSSGNWQIFDFNEYRGQPQFPDVNVKGISATSQDDHFKIRCTIPPADEAIVDLNLCAVIKISNMLTYWAARHPLRNPDFHARRYWLGKSS